MPRGRRKEWNLFMNDLWRGYTDNQNNWKECMVACRGYLKPVNKRRWSSKHLNYQLNKVVKYWVAKEKIKFFFDVHVHKTLITHSTPSIMYLK